MATTILRRAFVAAMLLALAGCGSGNNAANQNSGNNNLTTGIQGQVTQSPIQPVSLVGPSNSAPLSGVVILARKSDFSEAGRATSDAQGNYKLNLAPGAYQVQGLVPAGSQGYPRPPVAQSVQVPNSGYLTVNLNYDTGIR